ncbi:hypothetical protein D3C73_1331150 [compost metagenome]
MALLVAIGPGAIPARATVSANCASVIQPRVDTSCCMTGIMAYPPPKEIDPIIKKFQNNSINIIVYLTSNPIAKIIFMNLR